MDLTKIFQLKGLKPKNKGQANFYECCDLTKKVYLTHTHSIVYARNAIQVGPPPPSAFSEFMFTQ